MGCNKEFRWAEQQSGHSRGKSLVNLKTGQWKISKLKFRKIKEQKEQCQLQRSCLTASQNTIFSQEDYSFNLRMVVAKNKREFVYLNYK